MHKLIVLSLSSVALLIPSISSALTIHGDIHPERYTFFLTQEGSSQLKQANDRLSGLHGGKRLPECTQSENVRAGAAGDAEGIRTELREAPYQTGDTDQPDAERGKLRRLAAKM